MPGAEWPTALSSDQASFFLVVVLWFSCVKASCFNGLCSPLGVKTNLPPRVPIWYIILPLLLDDRGLASRA